MKKDRIKKNKKKVKFSFKRMLVYIATYLVCTVSVASLYVLSNSNSYSSNSPILFEEEEPSTLGLLVNNLMTLKDATVDINANVKKGDDELNVNIAGDVVIYEGFSNVDIDLTGTITYNQNLYTANIVYKDATMFISLNNQTYSFKASKLTDALGVVLTLVGMNDMQDLTGAFDMSMISSLEDKISEQALDNGVKLLFAITDDIELEILTDNNYNLKSVNFANYEYNDYLINASVVLPKTNSDVLIETPQNYKDITPAFDLLSSVINTAKFGGANFELAYDNYAVNGSINFKNQTLALKTNIQNNDIELYFKDNVVYLNTKQLKLKANISDIYDVIKQYLPDVNQNQALVMAVGAIEQLLNTDYFKSLDFSSITKQNDVVSIDLNSTKLNIDVKNNTINKIDVYYNQYNASVTLNYALTDLVVPNFEYINVFDLENLVEPIKQVVNAKSFSGTLNIDIDGVKNIFDVEINYNPLIVVVKGNVLNANIKVRYQDEYVYLSFNNSNLKFHINTFSEIFEFISNQNLSTAEVNQLGTVLNTVEKYLRLIINNNSYTFIYDDVTASIEINQNNLLNVLVNYQNYFVGLNINQINNQIEKVVECDFQLVEITCEDLNEFVENVTKNKYNLLTKITLNNKTYELDIKLSFENGLLLNLATTIDGYNLNAVIENKDVYINFDGIKITGNISQLPEIIKQVESEFNNKNISTLSTPNRPQDALNQVISLLNDINVNELISVIDLSCIDFIKDTFTINVNDNTVIKFQLNNNNISSLQLKIDNNLAVIENIKVTDQNCAKPLTKEEVESYKCNVTYLADLVTALNNSFKNNGITLTSTLNINGHLAYITTSIDKNQDIVANVTVEYKDIKLNVIYKNDDLYITLNNNIKIKTLVNDVETLKDLIITLLELNSAELEENADKIAEELTNQVENIVQNTKLTDYVKNIENTLGQTTIYLAGGVKLVVLNSNNLITGVNVYYEDNSLVNTLSYSSKINLPTITESEYVSAVNFIEKVNNTKDVLMGKFSGVITLNYNGEQVSVNYACDNTNGFKLLVYTTVLDKQLNIQFENNTIFFSYDEYKLMFEVGDFNEFINFINSTFGLDIKIPKINTKLTDSEIYGLVVYVLNNLNLTESQIKIGYENANATLTMSDYLSNINIAYNNDYINVSINKNNELTLPKIIVAEYKDWTHTADIIKHIYNLVKQDKFNLNVAVTYDKQTYNANVEIDLNVNVVKVSTNVSGYDLIIVLQDNTIYINFGGLKVYDSVENTISSVQYLMQMFDVDLGDTAGVLDKFNDINILDVIGSLTLYSFSEGNGYVSLSIADVLDLKTALNITGEQLLDLTIWHNDLGVNKLDITTEIITANVQLLTANKNIALSSQEITAYVTKLTDLVSYVERLYDSYENVKTSTGYAISGDIAVRYSNLQLNGKLNLNIINEKLYAHISSTAFGVDTNIYLVDKDIYVDVAGLKIKLKLSEADINYIINWVNTTFEQDIKFEFDGQMLDLKTPDLQNIGFDLQENNFGLTLSEYLLGGNLNTSFKEMLLNLIFDEGLLTTIDISTNVLDDNTFVYEQGYADNAFDFESEISKTRNLVLRLNNLAFGNGVNTQVWGFDKGVLNTLNNSALSEFNDYTNVLDIVEFAFDYYKQGNINLTADLTVNEKTGETTTRPVAQLTNGRIYSTLQLDDNYSPTSGTLYAGGNIIEYDYEKNTSITHTAALYFDNNYLYANYTHNNKVFNGGTNDVNEKSLNVKMQKDSIREILSLALHVLNIDLGTFAETLGIPSCDLNVENLRYLLGIKENNSGQIVSGIDTLLSNIENIIAIINNINLTVNGNTSKLSLGLKNYGQVINFEVVFVGGELSYISANNITVNETQTIDLKVSAVSMSDVPTYNTSTDHIDLTNISSLLKAFINTSALNDYHIKGKVALSVLSIEAAELDVDVKVKLVNRKPVVAVELGSYPLISGVNNVNTNGAGGLGILSPMRYRKINIYIQDGYAYLRTFDEKYSTLTNKYDEYERATKIKASTLGGQIEYYLQYLLGFTDSVQTSINQAIEAGRNRQYPINICNIINSFTFEENWYNISVNLSELAYSNDIGTMNLYLQTVNNESTNNLDYLYKLGLDVDMLSLLKLKTEKDSENILKLVDIGVEQDFSSVFNYMSDYSFGTDVEVQRAGSNALGVVNATSTTVNYISGTEYVADQTVSGAVGSDITGPAVTTYQVDDGKKVEYYAVSGWYLDKELTVPFTETKYSRFVNHTVYAKWELVDVKHYYTYTIHYNNVNNDVTLKVLEGQNIKLDDLSQYVEDDNVIKVTHNFKGWYLDSSFNTKFEFTTMPSYSFNVYAKWQTVTEYYHTISFETQFGNAPSAIHKLEEQSIALPTLQDYEVNNDGEVTLYTHIGWSLNADGGQIYQTTTMPTSDLTLYAVWQIKDHYTVKSVNFYKNGEFVATNTYRVGSVITPPAGFEYNENSLWYTDKEFNNLFETGLSVMPNYNIDLYVRNRYTITIVSAYGTVENKTISYYQGDTINIPAISSYYTDDYGNVKVVYTFLGYDNPTVMPSNNITVNALWKVENYYYVKLDTEQRYIFNLCAGKYGYSSNPTLATTYLEPVLEGTKISVAGYQPTCSAYRTAFRSGGYNYKCSGWSTSVPSNYSNGGGSFDFTITKPTTLYVCWQRV